MNTYTVHMIGIGGIGMSALAQLYAHQGCTVTGSDRESSPVTKLLENKGILVHIGHDAAHVAKEVDLVVYSDAVPQDNPERLVAQEWGVHELSYFEALGEATKEGTSIVVAGTHGKTTTTAMLAKVLIDTGKEPTVIAGSVLTEQGSNFVPGRSDLFVIEGCEYRRHFLHLHPDILIINNIELDHIDYYHDLTDMQDAFREVASRVPEEGTIVTDTDAGTIAPILHGLQATIVPYQHATVPTLRTPGVYNEANARAAKVATYALDPDVHEADIDRALADFSGTWRRFEHKGTTPTGALVYDDYAHHPTAVRGTIEMVRAEFPEKQLVVVFHPHLYSRTKQFFNAFVDALALADTVYLLPIYAAREKLDPSVTSNTLAEAVTKAGGDARYVADFVKAEQLLTIYGADTLILTMGAGDVYHVADAMVRHKT